MKTVLVFRTTNRGTWRETFGGMTGFAKSAGWQLQPVDARKVRPDFRALMDFWHPVGVVIDASGGTAFFKGADFGGLPAVAINPEDELAGGSMPAVANDANEISRLAMEELLRLAPESLLFVGWFAERDWCVARRKAAQKVATLHGMSLRLISPKPDDMANPIHFIERLATQIHAEFTPSLTTSGVLPWLRRCVWGLTFRAMCPWSPSMTIPRFARTARRR